MIRLIIDKIPIDSTPDEVSSFHIKYLSHNMYVEDGLRVRKLQYDVDIENMMTFFEFVTEEEAALFKLKCL
jgi:hypothetical protein